MAVTELLHTMALIESSHHDVKAGYVLDYPPVGVLAVMAQITQRFGKNGSEMHT